MWDGSWANNPWLQECPKPLSKEVWGHSLSISPADAKSLRVKAGDVVQFEHDNRSIEVTVRIDPGAAAGVGSLPLGYGRRNAGSIGNEIGANAHSLRTTEALWLLDDVTLNATGERHDILTTQNDVRLDGDPEHLYPRRSLTTLKNGRAIAASKASLPTLLPPHINDTYAWGMVIDTSACIGCNACVVACQAENNVPVVGPEEVARGRDMH